MILILLFLFFPLCNSNGLVKKRKNSVEEIISNDLPHVSFCIKWRDFRSILNVTVSEFEYVLNSLPDDESLILDCFIIFGYCDKFVS